MNRTYSSGIAATTPDEQERRNQIAEARRLSQLPVEDGEKHTLRGTETLRVPSKRDDRKQDGLKGHNALLSALKAAQTECEFIMAQTGAIIVGQVAHFDEETISVASRGGAPEVLFKHALRSFRPLHARREA